MELSVCSGTQAVGHGAQVASPKQQAGGPEPCKTLLLTWPPDKCAVAYASTAQRRMSSCCDSQPGSCCDSQPCSNTAKRAGR